MDLSIECPRVPLIGETMLGSNFFTNPGGKGANQAVAAAKLGATVHMLDAVGDDAFGDQVIASLAEAGVNCERIARVADCPTGVAMIERIAGDNCIVVDSGANMRPTAQFVREGLEEAARANGTAAQDAMRLATRASALATTRVGAQQSIPTLAEANSLE